MENMFLSLMLALCFGFGSCQNADNTNQNISSKPDETEQIITICVASPPDNHTDQINFENLPRIETIKFLSPNKIWLVTGFNGRNIYHTENAGKSWVKLQIQDTQYFNAFDFLDEQNGWLADFNSNIWKTTDGGETWDKLSPFADLIKRQNFLQVEKLKFTSPQNGWLLETFNVYHTEDAGKSWKRVTQLSAQPKDMFILNKNGWITFGKDSESAPLQMIRTSTNGRNWEKGTINGHNSTEAIFFLDDKTGWLSDSNYGFFSTIDSGKNWMKINLSQKNFQTKSIFWLDSQKGWLAGAVIDPDKPVSDPTVPTLLHTTDGGRTWSKFEIKNDERFFNEVYFNDADNGWLISKNRLYKTEDGGQTWKPVLKVNVVTKQNCD